MDKCAVQHISSQATFSQLHTLNNPHLRHKGTLEIIKFPENNNIPLSDINFTRRDRSSFSGSPFNCSETLRDKEMGPKAYKTYNIQVF